MGLVYLKHPVHGFKVETNDAIVALDKSNGWVEHDPEAPVIPSFLGPSGTPLPADFPGREALAEAGMLTVESITGKTSEELQSIRGIGLTTARKILDAQ